MNLQNYYYYFEKALPLKFCDDLIKYGLSKNDKLALTGEFEKETLSNKEVKDLKKKRDSNVVWLEEPWIYRQILPYVREANKQAGWNFEFEQSEPTQFTKYKLNQYYDWHCDSFDQPGKDGTIRKLSVTCQLSDGSEYEGGEFQVDFRNYDPNKRKKTNEITVKEIYAKGSIIVFPSFVWHRVKPVLKGTRYSLVIWNRGKPFK